MSGKKLDLEPVQSKDAFGNGANGTAYVIPFSTDTINSLGKSVQVRMDGKTVATFGPSGLALAGGYRLTLPEMTTAQRQAIVDAPDGTVVWDSDLAAIAVARAASWYVVTMEAE